MADTGPAEVTIRGRFLPGVEVGLYPRTGDFFRGGKALTSATVTKDGTVTFKGLPEGGRYFAAAEIDGNVRSAAVTAKVASGARSRQTPDEVRAALHQTRPPRGPVMHSGPRSTTSGRVRTASGSFFANPAMGVPTPKEEREGEGVPHLRQEDAQDAAQRSATVTGMATPKDPKEPVPAPSQEDFQDVPQRSATPAGVATPRQKGEEAGGARQEEAHKQPQRSATPEGVAEPKPKADPVETERAKQSSLGAARGGHEAEQATAQPPVKAEKPKAPAKPRARKPSGTRARKPAASRAKSNTKQKEK